MAGRKGSKKDMMGAKNMLTGRVRGYKLTGTKVPGATKPKKVK